MSDRSIDVCKENKISCFDAQGNCYIAGGPIYIEIRGIPNPNPIAQTAQSLFSPKSSRVSRVLLSNVKKWWQIQKIAEEAEISIGLVSTVKKQLLEEQLVEEQGKSIRVKDPIKLIDRWLEKYSFRKNKRREFYSFITGPSFERKIASACSERNIRYGLALFTGAAKVAPFVRMEKQFIFVEKDIEMIAADVKLKSVDSGANVVLLGPYDNGVFYRSNQSDGIEIVSDLQLYLDLKKFKGRGDEAASAILSQRLEPEWLQNLNTNSVE
ncbi:MAG TPA: type IV toxin-antitoxin system AbiEi family antitoxin [Bacteroidota bacterium]|nr:type IV toxin-antitoxin system AbiEi family antitoxin [Bacteroidota bacterium]